MKQAAALVAGGWLFLAVMAMMLHGLLRSGLTVYLAAGVIGVIFTLAVVFDALWRRYQ